MAGCLLPADWRRLLLLLLLLLLLQCQLCQLCGLSARRPCCCQDCVPPWAHLAVCWARLG